MMSCDENASGAWPSGLAPIFAHEFPHEQHTRSVLDNLIGTPLNDSIANLAIEDRSSHPDPSPEVEDQTPALDEKQHVIVTATIMPSKSTIELDHASENAIHSHAAPAMEADDLLEASDAFPTVITPNLDEDDEDLSRAEHAPLLAHECLGNGEEDVAMISSVPSISLTTLDNSCYRIPGESSIEIFPTDGKGIIDLIKMTERRLSEDLTSDDGSRMSSPSHMPTTPVDNVFSPRPRSASNEHSPRLDKIPEEFDLDEDMDTPDQIALGSESRNSSAAPPEELDAPLQSPTADSVSGASLLGHEILLPPSDDLEGVLPRQSPSLLAHETAGQERQDDPEKFPLDPESLIEGSKEIEFEHDTAEKIMTTNTTVAAGGSKHQDYLSVED